MNIIKAESGSIQIQIPKSQVAVDIAKKILDEMSKEIKKSK